jgi:serine/threonine protein kinase/WD40 repeat protein
VKETARSSYLARFESFEVNLRSGELFQNGERIKLPEQSFQILAMLLERPGEVVTRQEIQNRLWPNDTVVEFEASINAAIRRLRVGLGESADEPRYMETLARRGYRWKLQVEWIETSPAEPKAPSPSTAPPVESSASHLIGKRVSHYRVLEVLGGGGMGVVYKAEDIKLGRRVALKFLPEELAGDPATLKRFEQEARSASALNHPNICTIYAVEEHDGEPFIAMELMEGQTLRELIAQRQSAQRQSSTGNGTKNTRLELSTLLDISIQVAKGLEAAHSRNIIHRDIKPANIFITSHGQAKILDFGLAKLQEPESLNQAPPAFREPALEPVDISSTSLSLTRTGTTVGTAGYMSPEQLRGEKVDARTDLFSLGLVIYEMAAGQRAFSGESVPILRNAILNDTPAGVRTLNPEIPAGLEVIISRALEKDVQRRYHSAAEIRASLESELEAARKGSSRGKARYRRVAAGAVLAVLAVAAVVWLSKRPAPAPPPLKLRQLTTSSADNRVLSGAISPDGKYLEYTDSKGLHVQSVANGEERTMPRPAGLSPDLILEAAFFPWFADSSQFVVNAHLPGNEWTSQGTSVWVMPVSGGVPRKLRDDAVADSISPDGSTIAFTTHKGRFNDHDLWVMGPDGGQARKVVEVGESSWFYDQLWSPDSRRILYERIDGPGPGEIRSNNKFMIRDVKGDSQASIPPSLTQNWRLLAWLPDGRLIVSVQEPDAVNDTCNLWSMRIDQPTGKLVGEPKRLTTAAQFCMDDPTVSKDGKQLAFLQTKNYATVYMADLEDNGTSLRNTRHFILSETYDFLYDWSADGKTFFFGSPRDGYLRIYKQSLGSDAPELLLSVQGVIGDVRVSPDGKWILGLMSRKTAEGVERKPQLVRIPTGGGDPQIILQNHPVDQTFCARPPSNVCAVAELSKDRQQVRVTALDPVKGLGQELIRFDVDPNDQYWDCDISPDGTKLAVTVGENGPIRILSLRGLPEQRIRVKKLKGIRSVDWAGDGKGLFVSARQAGTEIWHVDLRGNAQILWTSEAFLGDSQEARPSPDGHHLAIQTWATSGNLWMMENF